MRAGVVLIAASRMTCDILHCHNHPWIAAEPYKTMRQQPYLRVAHAEIASPPPSGFLRPSDRIIRSRLSTYLFPQIITVSVFACLRLGATSTALVWCTCSFTQVLGDWGSGLVHTHMLTVWEPRAFEPVHVRVYAAVTLQVCPSTAHFPAHSPSWRRIALWQAPPAACIACCARLSPILTPPS